VQFGFLTLYLSQLNQYGQGRNLKGHEFFENLDDDDEQHETYMRMALDVGKSALEIGEVPVGCVIVMHADNGSVVVSHGANQVNCTRDATRHAEIVAIDRMLTGGKSSDLLRLPADAIASSAHTGNVPQTSALFSEERRKLLFKDKWTNVPDDPSHWKNNYGWGSGQIYPLAVFKKCDLYVTCEPCIMCAAALAKIGIGRVFFGCRNDRFGGCGSLMCLHKPDFLPGVSHTGYPIVTGILEKEAVTLLRSFYERENFHAPDAKRKKKETPADHNTKEAILKV